MILNVIIPMAGEGKRFIQRGYKVPKPFISVFGKPMIELVLLNILNINAAITLIIQQLHQRQYEQIVDDLIHSYKVKIVTVDGPTEGAAISVLAAHRLINNDSPLLIMNCDQLIDVDFRGFLEDIDARDLDGSLMTFQASETRWSYAQINPEGFVTEVREKEVISQFATAGVYYFRQGNMFVDSAIDMIVKNQRVNGEFYVGPVYNEAIQNGLKIGIFNIPRGCMHDLGTPEGLREYMGNQ